MRAASYTASWMYFSTGSYEGRYDVKINGDDNDDDDDDDDDDSYDYTPKFSSSQ